MKSAFLQSISHVGYVKSIQQSASAVAKQPNTCESRPHLALLMWRATPNFSHRIPSKHHTLQEFCLPLKSINPSSLAARCLCCGVLTWCSSVEEHTRWAGYLGFGPQTVLMEGAQTSRDVISICMWTYASNRTVRVDLKMRFKAFQKDLSMKLLMHQFFEGLARGEASGLME